MRIALAQLNYHIGNFASNTQKIISAIHRARKEGCDLVVFAELALCGYLPKDLLDYPGFIEDCHTRLKEIASHCEGIAAIVGAPAYNTGKGKSLFNSAFLLQDGLVKANVNKSLLPTYDVFDEYRYFEPSSDTSIIELKGYKIALTICEDLWNLGDHALYKHCPMDQLMKSTPDFMLNIAASPYSYEQQQERRGILLNNVVKYKIPLLYVNQVGAQTQLIFDGGSTVLNADQSVLDVLNYFSEDFRSYEISRDEQGKCLVNPVVANQIPSETNKISGIHDALILGIRDYFTKSGFSKAVLGLSGGIDSALVMALAVKALGEENIAAILMPSEYSSEHSVSDSITMVKTLNVKHHIIPIASIYKDFEQSLDPLFKGLPFNVAEENLQARIRGALLMAYSNKFGHILLNTTNKSEMAVGYGTLYGDMCGALAVIGDVYKTDVYELCRYINRQSEIIPENIINKAPSAELRPGQKDSDSLPEYPLLDGILYQYIEEKENREEIIKRGFPEEVVNRVIRLVNLNEFKRFQAAPVLRVSPKSFGSGRRMPIVAKFDF